MFHEADDGQDLLANWRWLLGGYARLLGWSSSGDLFVIDPCGVVSRLDAGGGDLEPVAATAADFHRLLHDPEGVDDLLLLPVVRAFERRYGPLRPGECLGFTTLPILGGGYTAENRFRLPIVEHAAVTGDLHRQLRDLPDGTKVSVRIVP